MSAAEPTPAGAAAYQVGPSDVLTVEVTGRRDLSGRYTVGQDGILSFPLLGAVRVEGRTPDELSSELTRRLSLYDRNITQISVSVAEFHSRSVLILGGVSRPGRYAFGKLPTIWDALGEAGGPTEDAQLASVEVIPADAGGGRTVEIVDVAAAIREGKLDSLPRLKPGDTVRVPRGVAAGTPSSSIVVFGAVVVPGSQQPDQSLDLVSALVRSGGPTVDADLSRIQIVRRSGARLVKLKVDLRDYLGASSTAGNPLLQPGDTVFLPRVSPRGSSAFEQIRNMTPLIALATAILAATRR